MAKKLLLLVILAFVGFPVLAQQVLIEEDLRGDTLTPDFGMNRKHYFHSYMGFHFPAGEGEETSANVALGRSWTFEYGTRYKRRFSDVFSGGLELVFKRSSYHPDNFLSFDFPDDYTYKREKFVFLSIGFAGYQRINFGARGNYIGRFLDVGFYGDVHYNVRHILRLEGTEDKMRVRRSNMGLHELASYGVIARIGLNNFVFKGSYRISDIFQSGSGLPEFTRFTFGMEMGLHPF